MNEYENEMCMEIGCHQVATGSTTLHVGGFRITVFNCTKHVQRALDVCDKLIKLDMRGEFRD